MKINRINLNCRRNTAAYGEISTECQLMVFRIPMIFTFDSMEKRINGCSAIIYTNGYQKYFRSAGGLGIKYDMISFRMSAADRQYAESMGIIMNTPIEIADDYVISGLLRTMAAHSVSKNRHHSEFMELSMRLIVIALSEAVRCESPDKYVDIPRYGELKAVREAIYDDPVNHWSAEEISEDMGISRPYFHRLYQEAFGVTCRQDIIESRLIYAAELLRTTEMSVSEVAEKCGYDSDAYFMRQFKQHKGCTPSEYRRASSAEKE